MENKTHKKKQTLFLIFFVICLSIGVFFLSKGLNNNRKISIQYKENNEVNYRVYLKENNFFETPYIEQGKTYITNLIDHIHIDFKYDIIFDHAIDASYKYYVMATVEANKPDNEIGNYWSKNYSITNQNEGNVKNQKHYLLTQSVDIDYNKYNEILNDFKKSVGLSNLDGVLKVYMVVESSVTGNDITSPISDNLMLKLPLSQLAIEASIESDVNNSINELSKITKEKKLIYLSQIGIGVFFIILAMISIIIIIIRKKNYEKNYEYELKLKKILTTYDSIIVNIKILPDIRKYNVINVESFEELIDAHSEVRMPINYYHTNKTAVFLLFNEATVWRYTVKKNDKKGSAKDEE